MDNCKDEQAYFFSCQNQHFECYNMLVILYKISFLFYYYKQSENHFILWLIEEVYVVLIVILFRDAIHSMLQLTFS